MSNEELEKYFQWFDGFLDEFLDTSKDIWKQCPKPPVVQNFTKQDFYQDWYELFRVKDSHEVGECNRQAWSDQRGNGNW